MKAKYYTYPCIEFYYYYNIERLSKYRKMVPDDEFGNLVPDEDEFFERNDKRILSMLNKKIQELSNKNLLVVTYNGKKINLKPITEFSYDEDGFYLDIELDIPIEELLKHTSNDYDSINSKWYSENFNWNTIKVEEYPNSIMKPCGLLGKHREYKNIININESIIKKNSI